MDHRNTNTAELTAGIDVGDRQSVVTFVDNRSGEVVRRMRIGTTREDLRRAFGRYRGLRVALETGTHSPWIAEELKALGHKPLVANSRRLHLISKNVRKNDRNDSELLARLARADERLLSPVRHRREEVRRDLALFRTREKLVEMRKQLVMSIRFTCKSFGYSVPTTSMAAFVKEVVPELPAELMYIVSSQVEVLKALNEQIRGLDRRLEELSRERYPETELLRQVPGVGPLTSLCFVLVIEDPWRFSRGRKVASYLGLTPRQDQSGSRDPSLPISKAGDAGLRRLLVQCAQHIMGPFGADTDLRRYGERILARQASPGGKRKAVVAVARKLAVVLHHLWRAGVEYEPLYESHKRGVESLRGAASMN